MVPYRQLLWTFRRVILHTNIVNIIPVQSIITVQVALSYLESLHWSRNVR